MSNSNEMLRPEVSGPFSRMDIMDRIEGIMLTRYTYTSFKAWDKGTLLKDAVLAGICNGNEIEEIHDEYCKFLGIAATIDFHVKPTGKVRELWKLHQTMQGYKEMCLANGSKELINPPKESSSIEGLYKIVFAELPESWK